MKSHKKGYTFRSALFVCHQNIRESKRCLEHSPYDARLANIISGAISVQDELEFELWKYFSDYHGLTLTTTELYDIIEEVQKLLNNI